VNSGPDESEGKPKMEGPGRRVSWPWWIWVIIILLPIPTGVGPWWVAAIFVAGFAVLIWAMLRHLKSKSSG
jgi:hypothetical protein